MKAIDIGSRRELMMDDYLVERLYGDISFRLHHPVPHEIALTMNQPWEQGSTHHGYMTVFYDEGKYRMYYAVRHRTHSEGETKTGTERICYAESADGSTWQRPELGLFEFEGSKNNNIVWTADGKERLGIHGFSPFRDPNPESSPEQRYKAIASGSNSSGKKGLMALKSGDGLHWSMLETEPIITDGAFDSQNLAFWDEVRREYRAYWRDFLKDADGNRYAPAGAHSDGKRFRGIKTATSSDFINWSDPQWLYYPGAEPEELYTNQITPYFRAPHIFLGFPARYVERPWSEAIEALPEPERRTELVRQSQQKRLGTAVSDTLFMSSRDGLTFNCSGEAFIRPGLRYADNWFYGDNYTNWGLVTTASNLEGAPAELSFYVSEGSRGDLGYPTKTFRRYSLRQDGFMSLTGGRRGAELLTRPIVFSGDMLELNFSASAAGSIRVELLDLNHSPLSDFALDDCVEILGDDLARKVRWKSGKDLASLTGRPVKLRFRLVDAELYAFRFTTRED